MSGKSSAGLAGTWAGALRADEVQERVRAGGSISFPAFLTSPEYAGPFNATVGVSPIVQAVAEASEGRAPTRIGERVADRVFRCSRAALDTGVRPQTVIVSAGRGGGKTSALLAPKAVHAAWTVPCPFARPGQELASVLMAPTLYQAEEGFRYVNGLIKASPILSRAVVDRSDARGLQFVSIRRPDGLVVRIGVKAANAQGGAARAPTLVFFGMDEGAFFADASGTKNDRAQYEAALGSFRNSPHAQVWIVSSPWLEAEGLMEEKIAAGWGVPSRAVLVAARVSTYDLKGIPDDGSERPRFGDDEDAYKREILAIPLPPGWHGFFDPAQIATALTRCAPTMAPEERGAGCDFGHAAERDNSGYALAARYPGGVFAALDTMEIRSVVGQKPSATYRAFGERMLARRIDRFAADVFHKASVREVMDELGIAFIDVTSKDKQYSGAKDVINEGRLCLGDLPEEERERLAGQLRSIVAKPKPTGGFSITAPRTSEGGHADTVSALVAALWLCGSTEPGSWGLRPDEPEPEDDYDEDEPYEREKGFDRDDLRW